MFANGICGIDIDNKTSDSELDVQAEAVMNLMDTYTERSPSGTGWHIIFSCDVSQIPTVNGKLDGQFYQKNPHNGLECYLSGLTNRYFTFTEQGNGKPIEDRTAQVLVFFEKYMFRDNFQEKREPTPMATPHTEGRETPTTTDILEQIRKSKQGYKFSTLFDRGDTSAYNNDDSVADIALCSILAFWLQGDFHEIDSYFRQSRLYRDKWERADYRANTINKAVDLCGGNYRKLPGRPKKTKEKRVYTETERDLLNKIVEKYGV